MTDAKMVIAYRHNFPHVGLQVVSTTPLLNVGAIYQETETGEEKCATYIDCNFVLKFLLAMKRQNMGSLLLDVFKLNAETTNLLQIFPTTEESLLMAILKITAPVIGLNKNLQSTFTFNILQGKCTLLMRLLHTKMEVMHWSEVIQK